MPAKRIKQARLAVFASILLAKRKDGRLGWSARD
jgi:hypothetical protein